MKQLDRENKNDMQRLGSARGGSKREASTVALCGRLPATHLFLGTPARLRTWILTAVAIKSVNPRMLKSNRAMTVQHHTMWIRAGQHKMLCPAEMAYL